AGALASLLSFAEALRASAVDKQPRVLAYQAEVLRLRGDYDTAQAMLRRAITLFEEAGDFVGEAESLHSLATISRRRGDYETAFAHLDHAMVLAGEATPVLITCRNSRGLCLMFTGDLSGADREFRFGLQLAEEQGDRPYARIIAHNLGLPAMIRGDFGEA